MTARKPPGEKEEWGKGQRGKPGEGGEWEGEVGCLLKTQILASWSCGLIPKGSVWPRAHGRFSVLLLSPVGLCEPLWMGGSSKGQSWRDFYPTFSDQGQLHDSARSPLGIVGLLVVDVLPQD